MNKFAKKSLPFWLPLCSLALLFANFITPVQGPPYALLASSAEHSTTGSPDSVLSVDYSRLAYLSKITPDTTSKVKCEEKVFSFLFQKDGKLTPQNGMYLATSQFIVPGLSARKLLYPFHSFL